MEIHHDPYRAIKTLFTQSITDHLGEAEKLKSQSHPTNPSPYYDTNHVKNNDAQQFGNPVDLNTGSNLMS